MTYHQIYFASQLRYINVKKCTLAFLYNYIFFKSLFPSRRKKTKRWKRNRNEKGKIYICLKSVRGVQQNISEQMFHPLISEIKAYKRSLPGKVPGETSLVLNLINYSSWNTSRKIKLFNFIAFGSIMVSSYFTLWIMLLFKPWTNVIFCLVPYQTNVSILIIEFEIAFFCLLKQ